MTLTDAEMTELMYGDRVNRSRGQVTHICVCGHSTRQHVGGDYNCMAGTEPRATEPPCPCPWVVGERWARGDYGDPDHYRQMQLRIWAEAFGRRAR